MRLLVVLFALIASSVAQAQDPLYVRTLDNLCWYDAYNQYRITWTEHHLGFNQTTGLYFVDVGCEGQSFTPGTDQATRTYTVVVAQDPCIVVDSVSAIVGNVNPYDTGCGLWTPPSGIELGPTAVIDIPGVGIQLPPQGAVGGTGITYTVNWNSPYDYEVVARASGPNAGGVDVIVETGTLLSAQFGNSCSKCAALAPTDPPPPPPPVPPVPPNNGGGGPNGETGPDFPGGPDNPEGVVCCQFADGTNQEMTYNDCEANGGVFWYPAPCELPIGCCSFMDPTTGEFMEANVTQGECVVLEGTWSEEPCEGDCAECCEAIRALLESFTDDVQAPLRDWLREDWPDFSTRVLAVLEEDADTPELEGVDPAEVQDTAGAADTYFDGTDIPDEATGSTGWEFDVLGTSQTFNISLDPRNWPDDGMHNTLAAAVLAMRTALSIGLTIMFGTLVGRVLRQW